MGTSGVPWTVDRDTIITTLKARKGRLSYVAKDLSCHVQTVKKRIDADPELTDLLSSLRNDFDTTMVDSAEDTLMYALTQRDTDLGNALKSTFYILNNKGKERGYAPKPTGDTGESIDLKALAQLAQGLSLPSEPLQSSLENQQSVFDKRSAGQEGNIQPELGAEGVMEQPPHM